MFAATERVEQARLLGTSRSNRVGDGRGYLLSNDREFLTTRAVAGTTDSALEAELTAARAEPTPCTR